jgi:hypothetical protein
MLLPFQFDSAYASRQPSYEPHVEIIGEPPDVDFPRLPHAWPTQSVPTLNRILVRREARMRRQPEQNEAPPYSTLSPRACERSESGSIDVEDADTRESSQSDTTDDLPFCVSDERILISILRAYTYDVFVLASSVLCGFKGLSEGGEELRKTESEGADCQKTKSSVNECSSTSSQRPSPSSASSQSKLRTRSHEDSEGEDHERRKRSKQAPVSRAQVLTLRLGCPFFKKNPERHQKPISCRGPGWDSVHRLK